MIVTTLTFLTLCVQAAWPFTLPASSGYVKVDKATSNVYVASLATSGLTAYQLYTNGSIIWTKTISVQASSTNNFVSIQVYFNQGKFYVLGVARNTVHGVDQGTIGQGCVMIFNKQDGNFTVTFQRQAVNPSVVLINGFESLGVDLYVTVTRIFTQTTQFNQYTSFRMLVNGTMELFSIFTGQVCATPGTIVVNTLGNAYLAFFTPSAIYSSSFNYNNNTYGAPAYITDGTFNQIYARFYQSGSGISLLFSSNQNQPQTLYQFTGAMSLINFETYASPVLGTVVMFDYSSFDDTLFYGGKLGTQGRIVQLNVTSGNLLYDVKFSTVILALAVDHEWFRIYQVSGSLLNYVQYKNISSSVVVSTSTTTFTSQTSTSINDLTASLVQSYSESSTSFETTSHMSVEETSSPTSQTIHTFYSTVLSSQSSTKGSVSPVQTSSVYRETIVTTTEHGPNLLFTFLAFTQVHTITSLLSQSQFVGSPSANFVQSSFFTYIQFGGGGLAGLLLLCCCVYVIFRNKRKSNQSTQALEYGNIGSTSHGSTSYSQQNSTSMATNTTLQTAVTGQKVLSVPGYRLMTRDVDYACEKQINEGGFATVYYGTLLNQDAISKAQGLAICAVKLLKTQENSSQAIIDEDEAAFIQEVSMLHFFNDCQFYVNLIGFSQSPNAIVMKYYQYGNVEDILKGKSIVQFQFDIMFRLLCDVTGALTMMHANDFMHCDIKPANIMIDMDSTRYHAVISDLGLGQVVGNQAMLVSAFKVSTLKGASFHYACPELLQVYRNPTIKVPTVVMETILKQDVYSTAIMGYEMVTRRNAWNAKSDQQLINLILSGERPLLPETSRDPKVSLILQQLTQAWNADATLRPTMKQLYVALLAIVDPQQIDSTLRKVQI